jgi:hypothetical protein
MMPLFADTASHTQDPVQQNLLVRYRHLVLIGVGLVLYVSCIGLRSMWYPDEPDVAQVAQAMFVSGDWIAPRRMGVIWVDYPPLLYWAGSIASYALGAMTEFSLRLPSALAAIALALLTCQAGSRWFDPSTGLWSGFLLLIFPQFALQAIGYRPDMLFSLFIGLGLFLYAYGSGDSIRWGLRAAGFASLGFAMLTKGPLGLLLPGLVLTLWHSFRREWRSLFGLALLSVISLAIYLAWFIACANEMGEHNILTELWLQNFARFGSGFRGHGRSFFYYFGTIWYDMAPWILLLPVALWWMYRRGAWQDRNHQFLLWWFGAFFVFLSIAVTKRQLYLLPAYPPVALIIGNWITCIIRSPTTENQLDRRLANLFVIVLAVAFFVTGGTFLLSSLGGGFVIPRLGLRPSIESVALNLRAPGFALGVLALGGGFWVLAAWRGSNLLSGFCRTATTVGCLFLVAFVWFMPGFDPIKTYKPAGRWIRQQIGTETRFGLAFPKRGSAKMGAFGFYSGRLVELLDSAEAIDQFFRDHPHSLVLLAKRSVKKIYGEDRTDWQSNIVRELAAGGFDFFVLEKTRQKPAS